MVDAWDWGYPLLGKSSWFWKTILLPWKSLVDDAFDLSFREQKEPDLLKLQLLGKTEMLWWWRFWCHEDTRFVLLKTSAMEIFLRKFPPKQKKIPQTPKTQKRKWKKIMKKDLLVKREKKCRVCLLYTAFKLSYIEEIWIRDEGKQFV